MRIAVISSGVLVCPPVGYSGLEMLTHQQAEGLSRLGHDVTLFAPDGSKCDHAKVFHFGPPGQWVEKPLYAKYWQELLNFDAVIDSSWNKWAYILKSEGRLKAPILGVMHAPINTMIGSLPPVEKPCFVCISQDQANHFEALFNKSAKVAYNGVDPSFYQPIPGIKRTDRFLFLARFSSIKGPLLAIEACKAAGVGLDLVGDTQITNEPEYFQRCKELCDGNQIKMVGNATRSECVFWFSKAHALIHPNRDYREPFGLAPVEAMMCGCPVIAWDNGAMRETVGPEVGMLVKNVDLLKYAVEEMAKMTMVETYRSRCRNWALKFSVDKMVKRYEELCLGAIEEPW